MSLIKMHINNIKSEGKESSKNFKSSKVVKETATNKLNIILAENMVKM